MTIIFVVLRPHATLAVEAQLPSEHRVRLFAVAAGVHKIGLSLLIAAVLGAGWPSSTVAAELRFRSSQAINGDKPARYSQQVLSAEEREFLRQLPEVRVAIPTPPNRPFETLSADGEISGPLPDLLSALAQTFGMRLKPVQVPSWSAALAAARQREVDIIMTIGVTEERLQYLSFTLGAAPVQGALFTRNGAPVDLTRSRIALERNYFTNDWVNRQYPQAPIHTVETTHEALLAVVEGRADAYLGGMLETVDSLSRQPIDGIQINQLLNYGSGFYHFGVRKDWEPLVAILNKGIHALRERVGTDMLALGEPAAGSNARRLLKLNAAESDFLANRPVWRVGAVRGLQLLNEVDSRGLHSGIASEYSEQVASRLGVAVQLRAFDSVAEMISALDAGDIDVVPFLTRTPQRAERFAFSEPYVEMPYALVARDDSPMYWGLEGLAGKSLALAPQHPLRDILAGRHPMIRVVDAASGQGAMNMVLEGKADAAVEVKLFANQRINAPGGHRLRMLSELQELPAQFHFATRRDQPVLLKLIDRALTDIEPDERQRMFRRWVAVDLQPAFPWQQYRPWIVSAVLALVALLLGWLWWTRRLQTEVSAHRRTQRLLKDITSTVPGIAFRYVMDRDGRPVHSFVTPGSQNVLGVELEPQRSMVDSLAPYMLPEELQAARAAEKHSLSTGEPFGITFRYAHPDGRARWLRAEVLLSPQKGSADVWTGFLVDVTTEHQLQQRLAQEADSRSLLLASASHELRAPTHALSLALQSLSTESLEAEQRKTLRVAQDSAQTLSQLLDDVLETARSGHDKIELRPRSFDLHLLLEDLSRAWRSAARTKGLVFNLDIAPDVPRTLQTDPLRLKQVMTNLLSNACKYTSSGSVTLSAERTPAAELRLSVSDTGMGIPAADKERLFQPYVRLDDQPAAPGEPGSTGLGLLTSRRLADLMGGSIELESHLGQGTRASFLLPLPAERLLPKLDSGDVLVCDDDATCRLLMVTMLRRRGFQTRDTADASMAFDLWQEAPVRAVVTDLDLPGMSGLDLIRALRQQEGPDQPRTPVIVCSGSPVPDADAAINAPLYDAYLVKPVDMNTLTDTLNRLGVTAD